MPSRKNNANNFLICIIKNVVSCKNNACLKLNVCSGKISFELLTCDKVFFGNSKGDNESPSDGGKC